jgi:SAM-dependent methyltransferase
MESVSCYNCGVADSTDFASENGYDLRKCTQCGLLYVNPRPDMAEIELAHKLGQHKGSKKLGTTGYYDFSKVSAYLRTLEDLFGDGSSMRGKRWLDIGCGYGEFMLALKKFSRSQLDVRGVEPNESKTAAARRQGLNASYFDLDQHTEKYDFISLLNVYSHLPDPPGAIAAWTHLLKPDGALVLETGDTADMPPESHPTPYYLPDHLSFASESIVRGVLEKAGFELIAVRKYPEVRETPSAVIREALKVLIPGKHSRILRVLKREVNHMDMYVLARLKRAPD